MSVFPRKKERSMSDILRAVDNDSPPPNLPAVRPRQQQPVPPTPPIFNAAYWLEFLKYGDMMEVATELHTLKGDNALSTPEDLAKLLWTWADSRKTMFVNQQQQTETE
jgi:hypothetical protein